MQWIEAVSPELNMVGAGSCEDEKSCPPGGAPDNLFFLVRDGAVAVKADNMSFSLHAGDWLVVAPSVNLAFEALSSPVSAFWFNFNLRGESGPVSDLARLPGKSLSGKLGTTGLSWPVWDAMLARWGSGDICEIMTCKALLLEILIRLFAGREKPVAVKDEVGVAACDAIPDEEMAMLVKKLLDEMPPQWQSVEKVVASMNLTHEYVGRIFLKYFGHSPLDYLSRRQHRAEAPVSDAGTEDNSSPLVRVEHGNGYYSYEPRANAKYDFSPRYDRYSVPAGAKNS